MAARGTGTALPTTVATRRRATEQGLHERITADYRIVLERFRIVVALRELGFEAYEQRGEIFIYNPPDGEGWRRFTSIADAQTFLWSIQAIDDGGCE